MISDGLANVNASGLRKRSLSQAEIFTTYAHMAGFEYDAVVYGAGPVGAAVALGLRQRGHKVIVFEKRSEAEVITDAGRSINLALSTRGRALLKEIGVYEHLKKTLVPMVMRRFADGSTEPYREPLQSINRNLLTVELIRAAPRPASRLSSAMASTETMATERLGT